ncbi:HAD-IA family hydrolase [soil metagenome]
MSVMAVVFDIGGVLEVTPPTGWRERWAARLGIDRAELTRRLEPTHRAGDIGTISEREVDERTAALLGLDDAALREWREDLWAEYLGTLNVELAGYFAGLRPRYRTGILSNSFVGARERERAAYDFEAMCDVVVYSHEEGVKKPDPRFYLIACERLGVEPEEVVFLDDVEMCVAGARDVGMRAVRFVDTAQAVAAVDEVLARRDS